MFQSYLKTQTQLIRALQSNLNFNILLFNLFLNQALLHRLKSNPQVSILEFQWWRKVILESCVNMQPNMLKVKWSKYQTNSHFLKVQDNHNSLLYLSSKLLIMLHTSKWYKIRKQKLYKAFNSSFSWSLKLFKELSLHSSWFSF